MGAEDERQECRQKDLRMKQYEARDGLGLTKRQQPKGCVNPFAIRKARQDVFDALKR